VIVEAGVLLAGYFLLADKRDKAVAREDDMNITPFRFLAMPMPVLDDGRKPQITSEFRPLDRPGHNGLDLFYRWKRDDLPASSGNGGAAGRMQDGSPNWVVPYGTHAIAAASGKVTIAGVTKTGHRLWIDHGNGLRTGYFHLTSLLVEKGDSVSVGQELGLVGDNPADYDARHLHFELSPSNSYSPMDPVPYFLEVT
jgi:murein DD-endopeptidase MepM/ murein hydrolase activator NlpD